MSISSKTTICAFIANPAGHSASPSMHNAGYKELNLDFRYVGFQVEDIGKGINAMKTLGIRGYSVSLPHKVDVMQFLDEIEPLAKSIGAVNTVVNDNGKITGYNSDCEGSVLALEEKTSINGKNVLIIGAGGAARAIVFGVKEKGGIVTIINRTNEKAKSLAEKAQTSWVSRENLKRELEKADIIINTTSFGMKPNINQRMIPKECLKPEHIVFDIVYVPKNTQLLKDAKEVGCTIVYGYKMLLYQAVKQFRLFTGQEAPVEVMEEALLDLLKNN